MLHFLLGPISSMAGGVCANGGSAVPWPCAVLKRLGVSATAQSRPAWPGWGAESRRGVLSGRSWEPKASSASARGASARGAAPVRRVGSAGAAAQIPDLLPPPLSVLGAAKNP